MPGGTFFDARQQNAAVSESETKWKTTYADNVQQVIRFGKL
jgi:hypothetical protein